MDTWSQQATAIARGALLSLLLAAGPAGAQFQSGNLYGTVTTTDGEPLPRVELALSGVGPARHRITDEEGQFRYLGLAPGNYELAAELQGFASATYEPVSILVGRNTSLQFQLSPIPEETIVVTAEPPLLTAATFSPGITVGRSELETIPTNRDPWSVADQAPGVLLAGVNVGGTESAQQLAFIGPGANRTENAFAIDGVVITDMAAIGYSPTYYDFDQFDEMTVTVGGSDVTVANSGVTINMVTKRGSDRARASARYLWTDDALQSSSDVASQGGGAGKASVSVNRLESVTDFGAEGGGPLIAGRLWGWGSYGLTDIRALSTVDTDDDTELEIFGGKLNTQLSPANSGVALFSNHQKRRDGIGAAADRAPETLERQGGPFRLFKLENTHLVRPGLYLSGLLSVIDTHFFLTPRGGRDVDALKDEEGVWRGTFFDAAYRRDSEQWRLNGSSFFQARYRDHELDYGASHRSFRATASERWGRRNLIHVAGENVGTPFDLLYAVRDGYSDATQSYDAVWVQDRIKLGRTTLSFGARYDRQRGRSAPFHIGANPALPELLPAIDVPARRPDFTWQTVSPRAGLSHAVGTEGKTVLRLAFSRFASQLHTAVVERENPVYDAVAVYGFDDLDGDSLFDSGENTFLLYTDGVDPGDPTDIGSPHRTDSRLRPEMTDELSLAVDREIEPGLVAGVRLTLREIDEILESRRMVRDEEGVSRLATRDDYLLSHVETGQLPDGHPFQAPVYTLAPGLRYTGGRLLTNGDRGQSYRGLTFSLTKRLTDRWMLRGQATASSWKWRIGREFLLHDDPTDIAPTAGTDSFVDSADSQRDAVSQQVQPFGRKNGFFLNSSWTVDLAGLYQVAPDKPWGFNLAGRVTGREGFPIPYFINVTPADGVTRAVQVTPRIDTYRHSDLFLLDLRVEKEIPLGAFSAVVGIDGFNLINNSAAIQRSRQLNGPQANLVTETVSPRVVRLGARLRWR